MFDLVINTPLGPNLVSNINIILSSYALFQILGKKTDTFPILVNFLIRLDANNITHFTPNLAPNSMSLFPAS